MQDQDHAGAVLRIDLAALVENYRIIQRHAAPAAVAGVVKADGYGLGARLVADALVSAGCRHLFVAHLGEAMALRSHLPRNIALYVLNGLQPGAEADCAAAGITPVLNSLDQVERWGALARASDRLLPAALQVDSGMARLGLPPEEVDALVAAPQMLQGVMLRLIMSHLACADDPFSRFDGVQRSRFEAMARHFPGVPRSLDNSGGGLLDRGHYDLVRAGVALYGGAPQIGDNPMRPVVSLNARIIQLRTAPAGSGIGYGLTHCCAGASRIATIPVGYADGWPRHLSNRGAAFIGGHRAAIVGRVSMDSITLDVTGVPDALCYPGAPVELIGPHQTVDDVAADAGTISYEILTQLGHRYHREVSGVDAMVAHERSMTA